MKKEEIQLFKNLCNFYKKDFDEKLLEYATPNVLGELFFNRMNGVAYRVLKKHRLLHKVNREFRNSLQMGYLYNIEKNNSFFFCLKYLSTIFEQADFKYALLKGALLCGNYPDGLRTSNDIDILVSPKDVPKVSILLSEHGFEQGKIMNDEFVPASRKEIIESKLTRGETVPFVKRVDLPKMKFIEVDINFSLDYKNDNDETVDAVLKDVCKYQIKGVEVQSLDNADFFLHICAHLYKEATTFPWVKMKRDMSIYKYCDVYFLLNEMCEHEIEAVFNKAASIGLEKICSFAILQMAELFEVERNDAVVFAAKILEEDKNMLHRVYSPKEKKNYIYKEKNILNRFFETERARLLEVEICTN